MSTSPLDSKDAIEGLCFLHEQGPWFLAKCRLENVSLPRQTSWSLELCRDTFEARLDRGGEAVALAVDRHDVLVVVQDASGHCGDCRVRAVLVPDDIHGLLATDVPGALLSVVPPHLRDWGVEETETHGIKSSRQRYLKEHRKEEGKGTLHCP